MQIELPILQNTQYKLPGFKELKHPCLLSREQMSVPLWTQWDSLRSKHAEEFTLLYSSAIRIV